MSSANKAPTSNHIISTEESGWTMYFEDFFNNNNDDNNNHKCSMSLSGVASSSSLVSDATSLVEKKRADNREHVEAEFSVIKNGTRSSFKKRKNILTALVDDALEDTATSPLNSPKVLYANQQLDMPKVQTEIVNLSQDKGNTSGQKDERKELSFNGRDSDWTELKKRGLCVVPLSMVANYLG